MSTNGSSIEYPMIDWCFDIELFYSSSDDNVSAPMQKKMQSYKIFSYRYNGIATCIMVALGLVGSMLLIKQIHGSRVFSRRLAVHLGMICVWDIFYLISCLATYSIPSLLYGMPPLYGPIAYVLFILQPFASFCVSCTIWQVFAITLERYWAVSKPLEQRTRKARFAVGWICAAIVAGAFILNLLPVPFERHLVPCFEVVDNAIFNHTLLKPYDDTRLYRFVVHFFPDLIFRAPIPIIIIGYLTVKTIQVCNQRTVGNVHINAQMKRNIPLRLSLLNFKFIICNTLYMFNTILLELLGYGESVESNEESIMDRYMNSFYLTDASNMLLVIHSATNWLLFYHWPKCNQKKRGFTSMTFASSLKAQQVKPKIAEFILKRIAHNKRNIGIDILTKLYVELPTLRSMLVENPFQKYSSHDPLEYDIKIQKNGEHVGLFIEQVLKWFSDRGSSDGVKELGRKLGYAHFEANVHFTPEQWKTIRTLVVGTITRYVPRESKDAPCSVYEMEETLTRAFNLVLAELRSGVLCAAVEANQKNGRSNSTCIWSTPREVPRKAKSVSHVKLRFSTTAADSKLFPPLINEKSPFT